MALPQFQGFTVERAEFVGTMQTQQQQPTPTVGDLFAPSKTPAVEVTPNNGKGGSFRE